jgi:hypothetical protein
VLASPAAGALFTALDAGAELGYDMPNVLRWLLARRPLDEPTDPVRDLAAVLHARVTTWLDNTETPEAPSYDGVDALIGHTRTNTAPDPGLRDALHDVDALLHARLDDLLDRPDTTWTDTLGPPPDDPHARAEWKRHARTVAAYRDLTDTATRSRGPRDQAADHRRRLLAQQAAAAARALTDPDVRRTASP